MTLTVLLLQVWGGGDLTLKATLRGHTRGVWCVQFSPVDKLLASASADTTIKIWMLDTMSLAAVSYSLMIHTQTDVVTHGMTVCDVVTHGMIVCDVVTHDMTVCGVVTHDMTVCDVVTHGMTVCGVVTHGMTVWCCYSLLGCV